MSLTSSQAVEAVKLRASGKTWKSLGEIFNCCPETVRISIDEAFKARRRQLNNLARQIRTGPVMKRRMLRIKIVATSGPRIPISIIAERDRAMSYETRDITAALMGDPLPGRSALDKKMGNTNG